MKEASNMRFTVGQDYYFARVLYTAAKDSFTFLYRPWEDTLQEIQVMKLTCTEHHKVAWDQDPKGEKNHDGFVFRDEKGRPWYNQYPTACYGQLDDTNDRVVFLHFELDEVYKVDENGKVMKGDDDKSIIIDQAKYDELEDTFWTNRFTLATHMLGSIERAIVPNRDGKKLLNENQEKLMIEYRDQFVAKVEKISGMKVDFKPLRMKRTDGGPDYVVEHYRVAELRPFDVLDTIDLDYAENFERNKS